MTAPALSLKSVSKSYRKLRALRDVSIDVPGAEITGIIGPDGAGKSTLLKICSGILGFEGSASLLGINLRKSPEACKRHLSFMPQGIGLNLYMDLSVGENLEFFSDLRAVPADLRASLGRRLLEATGLYPFRQRLARDLSGGMKQKLGLCCSLISRPELLILDEPSTGIDPLSRRQLWELLNEFISGNKTTVLMGSSYMDEAERCHSVVFLQDGETVFEGHPEKLMAGSEGLEEAFLGLLLERKGRRASDMEAPYEIPFEKEASARGRFAIEVEGVSKTFDSFRALDGVSMSISHSEVFGLLGPNGAGKTTLIKCMIGLLRPEEGTIRVSGLDPADRALRRRMGYMSQIFSLYGDLTVRENIELYGALYDLPKRELAERMHWVLGVAELRGMEGAMVKRLPLGMKQRLALGCATLNLPDILFLDEPTSGVDPLARRAFWQLIRALSRKLGITVLVTTHNLVEADYCDRVAIMDEGRIKVADTPGSLKASFTLVEGNVYEVYPETPFPEEAFRASHMSFAPFGRRYHVWKKGVEEEAIKAMLDRAGTRYRYLRLIPPPMEDVFIHYLGER